MRQKLTRINSNYQENFIYDRNNPQKKNCVEWSQEDDQKLINLVNQTQNQINWKEVALNFLNKKDIDCISRWREINNADTNSIKWKKKSWTEDQDAFLIQLIEKHGPQKWTFIAEHLPGRIGKQCRQRWHNHLNPSIKKQQWSDHEQWLLFLSHKVLGNRWAQIAKYITGRTDNSIKNHWNSSMKKRISELYQRFRQFKKIHDLKNSAIFGKLSQTEKILLQKLHKVQDQQDQIKQSEQRKQKKGFQMTPAFRNQLQSQESIKKNNEVQNEKIQGQSIQIIVQQKQKIEIMEENKVRQEKFKSKKKKYRFLSDQEKTSKKNNEKFNIMITPKKQDKLVVNNVFMSPPKMSQMKGYHQNSIQKQIGVDINDRFTENIYKSYESPSYLLNLFTPEKIGNASFAKIVLFKNNE